MKPPPPFSRSLWMMRFSRCRSSSDAILRDTPVWFTVGMKTRKRPGSAMWLVMRAPFFAIGSLAIWISTSCPSLSSSLICGTTVIFAAAEAPSTAASATPIEPAIRSALGPATLRPLQQPRLGRRTANFRARIHRAVANRFGLQQRLGFGLRLFQFQLLGFPLFGFQHGFRNRFAVRRRLAARPPARSNSLRHRTPPTLPRPRAFLLPVPQNRRRLPALPRRTSSSASSSSISCSSTAPCATFVRNFALCVNLVGQLRRRRRIRLVRRRLRLRSNVSTTASRLVPEFSYFRRGAGSGSVPRPASSTSASARAHAVRAEARQPPPRKSAHLQESSQRSPPASAVPLQPRSPPAKLGFRCDLTLRLPLVLRDRFAGKHDRLISRRRPVIVVATGTRAGGAGPLESRVGSAASGTVAAAKTVVSRFISRFTADFVTQVPLAFHVCGCASNFAAVGTRTRATPNLSAASATAAASAKVTRTARGAARRFPGSRFRLFPLAPCAAGFGKLSVTVHGFGTRFQTVARTRLRHRTIRRDRFIQVFVLLFQIHEIGDVQEGVAFQPDVHKGRLHAGQHARHSALINRAC